MRIGVDTGGTFTDCVVVDASGIRALKVFSTPDDAARAILEGARGISARNPRQSLDIAHGTTLGTNSLLERRGARVALVTTAGFEDLIEIGRQNRPQLYDLNVRRDPALVPRQLRFGVVERTAASGQSLQRPSPAEIRRVLGRIRRSATDSVGICFLFSFVNSAHEEALAKAIRKLGIPVSVSHEILPEFREYERLSSVVVNAYLALRMGGYLRRLQKAVSKAHGGRVYVMQSSGGITTSARAAREPVRTILSGPAGGVVATAWLAKRIKTPRAISFDMGGTSTDLCLIEGQPRTTNETTLGGLPVAVPVLDVHSVGAGGGSIARFDPGGALRVGPESAGAMPGPACYHRGGTRPTVTDANLVLGRLDPDYFLGGSYSLDPGAAERALKLLLREAGPRFNSPIELAQGIVAVANANMERALRVISVERGHDPRDFVLVCFGGAGGLHAVELAGRAGISKVIVPPSPGAFSALGILISDIVKDVSLSVLLPVPNAQGKHTAGFSKFFAELSSRISHLEAEGRAQLQREGFASGHVKAVRALDLRVAGQAYELTVPFAADFPSQFHREHLKAYGYTHRGQPLEVVNLRVRLTMPTPKPPFRNHAAIRGTPREALLKKKPVWLDSRFREASFYDRERLRAGTEVRGPGVIVEYSSTTVVPAGWQCKIDRHLNLVLTTGDR
ncbi:MAG: hydantoinase/oxoprolinase family protein [Terriglobia bacterium]